MTLKSIEICTKTWLECNVKPACMISECIYLQIVYFNVTTSLEIINHSPGLIIAKSGESLELFCDSKEPYQWCMMKHNRWPEGEIHDSNLSIILTVKST